MQLGGTLEGYSDLIQRLGEKEEADAIRSTSLANPANPRTPEPWLYPADDDLGFR